MDAGVLGVVVGQFGLLLGFMVFFMRRMDRLEERLGARMDRLEDKIDRLEERLEKKIDDLAQEVAVLRGRMDRVDGQMELIKELFIRFQTGERPAEEPQPA